MRCTVDLDTLVSLASERQVQFVAFGGLLFRVLLMSWATCSSLIERGAPILGSS